MDIGKMIKNMAKEKNLIVMAVSMKVFLNMVKEMVLEWWFIMKLWIILVNGKTTNKKVMEKFHSIIKLYLEYFKITNFNALNLLI